MLRGPSTRASYYFVVPPEGKSCVQACSSAAGPGADDSSWGVSRASLFPTAHLPSPVLLPTAPSAPMAQCSALLPACSAQIPPPARSHGLGLLSASPQAHTLPRQEPQQVQPGEAQSPAPGEGQPQPPAHRITESQKGNVSKGSLNPDSQSFFLLQYTIV